MLDRKDWWTALWISWRHLRTKQRRAGLSFLTTVTIAGVCIGVAALIIVLSVMGGFEQDLRRKMLAGQPHFEIMNKSAAAGFSLKEFPLETFQQTFPEHSEIEPFVQADIVLKHGQHLSSATIFGIDPAREAHLWGFGQVVARGEFKDLTKTHPPIVSAEKNPPKWPGILLGEGLAAQLGVDIGDEIIAINPQGATQVGSVMTGGTLSRHFVVVGMFRTEMFNYDSRWAVVDLPQARKFMADYDESLDRDEFVSGVAMNFEDPYIVSKIEPRIKSFEGLEVLTWEEVNSSLLFALKLEKFTMGAILMLIVVVAAFSISGTMMMNVYHRRTQISLLRSLGMSKRGIARLFMVHGVSISVVGVIVGLVIGLSVCTVIHYFQFINLPANVYYLKRLPVKFLPSNYVVICMSAIVFGVFASLYPAMTAARQEPSEGLRF